ncbi:MAG: tRNA pseudouridine(13) synthase TruD [Gammaproteobacteria bacterium]|nr:tRNA pseudouridine(13) synthase TruD [Gammaproteobacteria bacterium]
MNFDFRWAFVKQPEGTAIFKSLPEDFIVDEVPLETPSGEGEHLWLKVRKRGENTHWIADQLALSAEVAPNDVGVAGRKDRHAVTTQWFSIYDPKQQLSPERLVFSGELLEAKRHVKKLRRGMLLGNRFQIRLRHCSLAEEIVDACQRVQVQGVPNYFGMQRFGRDQQNVARAWQLAQKRKLNKRGNDIYLSAARSYLFNHLVSQAIHEGHWRDAELEMWGRGRASQWAIDALNPWKDLADALEFTGLKQDKRAARLQPEELSYQREADVVDLSFTLPAGGYATTVLREITNLKEERE